MEIEDTSEYAGVIYGLHTGDFDFRYVGKTTQPVSNRLYKHRHAAKSGKSAVYNWIRKHGIDAIQVCVIETFDEETIGLIDEREIFHIAQARAYYSKNLNLTDGGEGMAGHVFTDQHRSRLSAANTARYQNPEERAKTGAAAKGRIKTPEERANISASKLANPSPGGHSRWHVARNLINPNCNFCKEA